MTRGELLAAPHGTPDTTKRPTPKRGDATVTVDAKVTGF